LKNTTHFINSCEEIILPTEKKKIYLITFDVESMYTSIPILEAYKVIVNILKMNLDNIDLPCTFSNFTMALYYSITSNILEFDNRIFIQLKVYLWE